MLLLVMALLVVAGAVVPASAKPRKTRITQSDREKADYIFLEGLRHQSYGNEDAYYELLKRSYELNPEDDYVGMEYGYNMMRLAEEDDSVKLSEGYRLMKRYADTHSEDLYTNAVFAQISDIVGRRDEAVKVWERMHYAHSGRPEVTMRYASMLSAQRDSLSISRAIALFDSLEVSEGTTIPLINQKLQLYLVKGDTTAMDREVAKLMASSPRSVECNVFAGDYFAQFDRPDSALIYYNRAVELDPSNGLAHYSRATFYRNTGDSIAYDREVFEALRQESLDLEPKLEILREYVAALYTDSVQQPRISDLFKVLIDQHPHEAEVHNLYRDYLVAINDYVGAAEQTSYSLDIDPSDERMWMALASLYFQIKDYPRTTDAADRGMRYFPGNTTLHLIKASALSNEDKRSEAIEVLGRALELTDSDDTDSQSEILTAIGDTYYSWEKTDSAFTYYEKAIATDPDNITALNNCAYYLACENRDLDKAERLMEKVMEEAGHDATYIDTYAWVMFRKKDYAKAKELIDEALSDEEAISGDVLEHAGDIYFMNQLPDEALEFWKNALELNPDNELLQRKVKHKTYYFK